MRDSCSREPEVTEAVQISQGRQLDVDGGLFDQDARRAARQTYQRSHESLQRVMIPPVLREK